MKGNNPRPWTDQVAGGGRPRVHSSLEHTFKDKIKMTVEAGGERHSAASTLQICMSHPSCRGSRIGERLPLPCLHSQSKELGHKDGDVTKGLLMEVSLFVHCLHLHSGARPSLRSAGAGLV